MHFECIFYQTLIKFKNIGTNKEVKKVKRVNNKGRDRGELDRVR